MEFLVTPIRFGTLSILKLTRYDVTTGVRLLASIQNAKMVSETPVSISTITNRFIVETLTNALAGSQHPREQRVVRNE